MRQNPACAAGGTAIFTGVTFCRIQDGFAARICGLRKFAWHFFRPWAIGFAGFGFKSLRLCISHGGNLCKGSGAKNEI